MSRDMTTDLANALMGENLHPIFLFVANFDSGVARAWTGLGNITWGGNVYSGTGTYLRFTPISESEEVKANGVSFELSAVPQEMIALALNEEYQGRALQIYFGVLDQDTGEIINDPVLAFDGKMDVMEVVPTSSTLTINMSVESSLIDLERPRTLRYTHEDQQTIFPGDMGLIFVPKMQEKQFIWNQNTKS